MKTFLCLMVAIAAVSAFENVDITKVKGPGVVRGPEGRIVGGTEAKPHSLPYQIGLLTEKAEGQYWCGGSLIDPHWVLTAAHCLENVKKAVVFVGAHDISNNYERGQSRIMVDSSRFIIHETWDTRIVRDDIALIYLPKAVQINQYVKTVRLPSRSEARESMEGEELLASGWGRFSDYDNQTPTRLLQVRLPIISQRACNRFFQSLIRPSNICASGVSHKSTCSGDSGGPLVADMPSGPTIFGLTSFGSNQGCQVGWPSVFTRVGYYLDWISRKTGISIKA